MSETSDFPVTVLGTGPMGRALAGAFLDRGHPTTVWNRTPGRAPDLVARGAVEAPSVGAAVTPGSLVVICVLDYDALAAVLEPAAAQLAEATVLSLTAGTPARARATAEWAAAHRIPYLDGAIMSPVPTIGTDDAVLLYSGPPALYERHRDTLGALGGSATHLGDDPGRAATYDVALLDLFWTTMSGYVHALALARTQGIAARDLAGYATGVIGLMDDIVPAFAEDLDTARFDGDTSALVSARSALEHIALASEEAGVDSGVLRAAAAVAGRAIDDGHGDDGFARLAETLSRHVTDHRS
jgi:3-hydroxyisobutyrate dehydrogenase-like beta-hydroxyacid dehydrogenase